MAKIENRHLYLGCNALPRACNAAANSGLQTHYINATAENHEIVRDSLKAIFDRDPDSAVVIDLGTPTDMSARVINEIFGAAIEGRHGDRAIFLVAAEDLSQCLLQAEPFRNRFANKL